jgi:hypothetical protein
MDTAEVHAGKPQLAANEEQPSSPMSGSSLSPGYSAMSDLIQSAALETVHRSPAQNSIDACFRTGN